MFSKNNKEMMIRKNRPVRQRWGLRKLTVGVASVLLGLSWAAASVSADTGGKTAAT